MTDRPRSVAADGRIARPSWNAPPPRTASKRRPVARVTTSAGSGPSPSTAQRLVANQGMPRRALVEPSTGSITTSTSRSPSVTPDSSLSTPKPARSRIVSATSSAARSLKYWLALAVPARPQSSRPSRTPRMATATSSSTCRTPSPSMLTGSDATVATMALRPATIDDLDEIVALINDLATYERAPEEVVLDPDVLAGHLFGDDPAAAVTLAVDDDSAEVAGFALYFRTFSTWLGVPGLWL